MPEAAITPTDALRQIGVGVRDDALVPTFLAGRVGYELNATDVVTFLSIEIEASVPDTLVEATALGEALKVQRSRDRFVYLEQVRHEVDGRPCTAVLATTADEDGPEMHVVTSVVEVASRHFVVIHLQSPFGLDHVNDVYRSLIETLTIGVESE